MTDEHKISLQSFGQLYGPYAFGVISLLIIWFAIVKPELDHRALDFKAQTELIAALNERGHIVTELAKTMDSTAKTMDATAEILERIADKLAKVNGDGNN